MENKHKKEEKSLHTHVTMSHAKVIKFIYMKQNWKPLILWNVEVYLSNLIYNLSQDPTGFVPGRYIETSIH